MDRRSSKAQGHGEGAAGDPRDDAAAFGRLLARLNAPFSDRNALLAEHHLTAIDFAKLSESWTARLVVDGSARLLFEGTFSAEHARSRAGKEINSGATPRENPNETIAIRGAPIAPSP